MRLTIAFSVAGGVEEEASAGGPGVAVRGCGVAAARSGGTTGGKGSGALVIAGEASPGNDCARTMVPEGLAEEGSPSRGRSPVCVRVRSEATSGELARDIDIKPGEISATKSHEHRRRGERGRVLYFA